LGLAVAAYLINTLTGLFVIFLMSLFLLEMAQIAHKAGIDPVSVFDLDVPYDQKFRNVLLAELLGIKFMCLFLFGMVAWIGAYGWIALPILLLLHGIFNMFFVVMGIVGNRIRLASIIYQWMLVVLLTVVFGFSGFNPVQTEAVHDMHLVFQDWITANFVDILATLVLSLIGLYYAGMFFTKRLYDRRPFINPESFPREMV
jgi:hypothetical protein